MKSDRRTFYLDLIGSFVRGELQIAEFERRYLAAFKSETADLPAMLYTMLEQLFSDVDAYSPDYLAGHETDFVISEVRLRAQAADALISLEHLLVTR